MTDKKTAPASVRDALFPPADLRHANMVRVRLAGMFVPPPKAKQSVRDAFKARFNQMVWDARTTLETMENEWIAVLHKHKGRVEMSEDTANKLARARAELVITQDYEMLVTSRMAIGA